MSNRLEVSLNGYKLCVAGMEGHGTASATIEWSKPHPDMCAPFGDEARKAQPELTLSVTGVDANIPSALRHLIWAIQDMKEGDEVLIKVLPPGAIDAPGRATPFPIPHSKNGQA
jgi:hypothetical protein